MELFRVILVITGVLLLGVAFLMGRKKTKTNVYSRAIPDAYDPSLDELSVPLADTAPNEDWQTDNIDSALSAETDQPVERTGASSMVFDADAELSDDEIDSDLPSNPGYAIDPVQTEIEISKEFDDIDLDVDVEEATERADIVKVTSLASAVKMASHADATDKNFSEEFQSYHEDHIEGQSAGAGNSESYDEPVQLEHFEEKLVTVHVVAQNDRRFYGSDLKALFDQHGYTYGRMSIYHCALDGDKVFSIANMVKPGTFEDEQMSSFETPGLTLFMRLPIALDADVAFDFLIREANGLAEELGGHLRDGNRNPLSEQTIQHMREDVQQYVFRSKRVLHTS